MSLHSHDLKTLTVLVVIVGRPWTPGEVLVYAHNVKYLMLFTIFMNLVPSFKCKRCVVQLVQGLIYNMDIYISYSFHGLIVGLKQETHYYYYYYYCYFYCYLFQIKILLTIAQSTLRLSVWTVKRWVTSVVLRNHSATGLHSKCLGYHNMQPYFKQTKINCVEMKQWHLDVTLQMTQITDNLHQQSGIFIVHLSVI